jgi:hypothetical protein
VWSDIVQHSEQLHLLRLCLWGGLSTVVGTLLVVISTVGRGNSPLLRRFGLLCALLGAIELIVGAIGYRNVALRDVSGAARLDRLAWLQLGLYLGVAGVGATLAVTTHRWSRRADLPVQQALPILGAGLAILLHGLGLATLALFLIADISR